MNQDIPIKRLAYFRKEIGLDESKLAALRPYADALAGRAGKAGKYLDALMRKVAPRARLELSLDTFDGALKHFWTNWYQTLWTGPWDDSFLEDLWKQGAYAARLGIDLQYVMLGDIKCRQIFLKAVRDNVPLEKRAPVVSAVNVLLDLCLMVRSKGHVAQLTQVTEPLLQGLFHQTRNPITIIGGTAMRLMRSSDHEVKELAQVILDEALRMERMTRDISTLNSVMMAEPMPETVRLAPLLLSILDGLRLGRQWPEGLASEVDLDEAHPEVDCDPSLARELFKEVLVNALEGVTPEQCWLRITSGVEASAPSHLCVRVHSGGSLPDGQEVDTLYLPFHSTKPQGTGFGLAIARAAARKCFGRIRLSQAGDGVLCTVKLPLKGQVDEAGLMAQMDF